MPTDEMVEKVALDAAKKMFFGLDPIDGPGDESDTYLVSFDVAVKHIGAAVRATLEAAEAGAVPVAWERRLTYSPNGAVDEWQKCTAAEAAGHFERRPGYEYRALYASPPSEASREERETSSPGPWPTEAEYELWQNDEFAAGASGSPEDAAREIMHYAAVYGQDGPVKIYEVKRYEVSPDALATAIRARGGDMPLTVVIKLNGKTIAGADIANISNLADVSDYLVLGYEQASDVTGLPYRGATTHVRGHKRRQSVWSLVEKAASTLKGG